MAVQLANTPPEGRLETHDISIPYMPGSRNANRTVDTNYKLLLLSAADLEHHPTAHRVNRFVQHHGVKNVAIVFLLGPNIEQCMSQFMSLQME